MHLESCLFDEIYEFWINEFAGLTSSNLRVMLAVFSAVETVKSKANELIALPEWDISTENEVRTILTSVNKESIPLAVKKTMIVTFWQIQISVMYLRIASEYSDAHASEITWNDLTALASYEKNWGKALSKHVQTKIEKKPDPSEHEMIIQYLQADLDSKINSNLINRWLNGDIVSRHALVQLVFVFGMSFQRLASLLFAYQYKPYSFRNPDEVLVYYAIQRKYDFVHYICLRSQMRWLEFEDIISGISKSEDIELEKIAKDAKVVLTELSPFALFPLLPGINQKLCRMTDKVKQLLDYSTKMLNKGEMHSNTKLIDYLEPPELDLVNSRTKRIRNFMEEILDRASKKTVVDSKKNAGFSTHMVLLSENPGVNDEQYIKTVFSFQRTGQTCRDSSRREATKLLAQILKKMNSDSEKAKCETIYDSVSKILATCRVYTVDPEFDGEIIRWMNINTPDDMLYVRRFVELCKEDAGFFSSKNIAGLGKQPWTTLMHDFYALRNCITVDHQKYAALLTELLNTEKEDEQRLHIVRMLLQRLIDIFLAHYLMFSEMKQIVDAIVLGKAEISEGFLVCLALAADISPEEILYGAEYDPAWLARHNPRWEEEKKKILLTENEALAKIEDKIRYWSAYRHMESTARKIMAKKPFFVAEYLNTNLEEVFTDQLNKWFSATRDFLSEQQHFNLKNYAVSSSSTAFLSAHNLVYD